MKNVEQNWFIAQNGRISTAPPQEKLFAPGNMTGCDARITDGGSSLTNTIALRIIPVLAVGQMTIQIGLKEA